MGCNGTCAPSRGDTRLDTSDRRNGVLGAEADVLLLVRIVSLRVHHPREPALGASVDISGAAWFTGPFLFYEDEIELT